MKGIGKNWKNKQFNVRKDISEKKRGIYLTAMILLFCVKKTKSESDYLNNILLLKSDHKDTFLEEKSGIYLIKITAIIVLFSVKKNLSLTI